MKKTTAVKEQILKTASRLFYEQGYNLTGINQIITEAAIARGSLYIHFSSKEELCVAYLKNKHTRWFEDLKNFIDKKSDSEQKVVALFDFLIVNAPKENFRGCSFLNIVTEVPNESKITDEAARNKKVLRDFIHQLVEGLEDAKNEDLADEIYLLFEGAITESQMQRSIWPIQTAKKLLNKLI
jgi:AcrR family transcriptional regulator